MPDGSFETISGGPVTFLAICNERQTQMKTSGKVIESLYCLILKRVVGH
jgi:hypothetical protein